MVLDERGVGFSRRWRDKVAELRILKHPCHTSGDQKRGGAWATVFHELGLEHPPIVAVPVALESLIRIIVPLQTKKVRELRVAGFHLLAGRPSVVRQKIASLIGNRQIN